MKAVIFGIVKCALLLQLSMIHASPHPAQTPYMYGYPSYANQPLQQSYLGQYRQLLSRQRQPYPGHYQHEYAPPAHPVQGHVQHDYQTPVQQGHVQQDYPTPVQGQQEYPAPVQQVQVAQDQGNVYQPPRQQDGSDDRAQHYGGNGSPLIFIYPTEGDPLVVHDQKQQRPPMQIFGNFNPQRPSSQQDSPQLPFFQFPTQILSQPGPIRQWMDNVGNWFNPPRQAMTVLYPTTSTVLVPHFVTVTASCTN